MRVSAERLQKAEQAAGVTPEELCERLGMSVGTLDWIVGRGGCEYATLERIADELNVDAGDILLADAMADNENVIEFIKNEKRAVVTLSQGRFIAKVEKLAEEYPDEARIIAENEDGTICASVPVSWIKITPPRKLSDEDRERRAERMRVMRTTGTADGED